MQIKKFQKMIGDFYKKNRRKLPWRPPLLRLRKDGSADFYPILISEIMLQQTQVDRVIPKYKSFLKKFPTVQKLAAASLADVLREWQGLGYNRRARMLHEAAKMICEEWNGKLPIDPLKIDLLPGVGVNTAGSISAFVFNMPVIFIETNIRSAFLHHFFKDKENIDDKEILKLIEKTLDRKNPREWYYALMDYGSYLKRIVQNPSRASKHYIRQSTFRGSDRQIRGALIRLLLQKPHSHDALLEHSLCDDERLERILFQLMQERLISKKGRKYLIQS